jgi:hypothetical protein
VATIPWVIPPNTMFNGWSYISTMHYYAFLLIIYATCSGFGCQYFILWFITIHIFKTYDLYIVIIWSTYNQHMARKNQHTNHIQSTYDENPIVGIKGWTLVSLESIQGLCHPTTILHCNKTCPKLHISNYK